MQQGIFHRPERRRTAVSLRAVDQRFQALADAALVFDNGNSDRLGLQSNPAYSIWEALSPPILGGPGARKRRGQLQLRAAAGFGLQFECGPQPGRAALHIHQAIPGAGCGCLESPSVIADAQLQTSLPYMHFDAGLCTC